jgi:hypothetical protein
MKWTKILVFFAVLAASLGPLGLREAQGGFGELSATGSYSRSNFGNNTYSTTRRWTTALSWFLTSVTALELSYTATDTFFNYDPVQTTSINEQALGLSLVQALVPQSFVIQPYVKGGVAQYNRKQSGTISGIPTAPTESKSPSGLLGAGAKIFLLRNFSLKIEAVTFLPDLLIKEAKNNFTVSGGFGWQF